MKKRAILLQVVLALAPMIYFLSLWNSLPARVPLHFNRNMVADDYCSKWSVATILVFFAALVSRTIVKGIATKCIGSFFR